MRSERAAREPKFANVALRTWKLPWWLFRRFARKISTLPIFCGSFLAEEVFTRGFLTRLPAKCKTKWEMPLSTIWMSSRGMNAQVGCPSRVLSTRDFAKFTPTSSPNSKKSLLETTICCQCKSIGKSSSSICPQTSCKGEFLPCGKMREIRLETICGKFSWKSTIRPKEANQWKTTISQLKHWCWSTCTQELTRMCPQELIIYSSHPGVYTPKLVKSAFLSTPPNLTILTVKRCQLWLVSSMSLEMRSLAQRRATA